MLVSQFCYQVRHYENRKTRRTTAGTDAADAEARRLTIQRQVSIRAAAAEANMVVVEGMVRRALKETAVEYIKMKKDSRHLEAAAQARLVTKEAVELTKKTCVDEIKPTDFSHFHQALWKRKLSNRTVANKHERLASWLAYAGIDKDIIPPAPKYEEGLPTIYERDQISTMLGAADDYMTMVVIDLLPVRRIFAGQRQGGYPSELTSRAPNLQAWQQPHLNLISHLQSPVSLSWSKTQFACAYLHQVSVERSTERRSAFA